MTFIILIIIIVIAVQFWTMQYGLNGIEYTSSNSKYLVEEDEKFEYLTMLTNRSPRFIPYVRITEVFPEHAVLERSDRPMEGSLLKVQAYSFSTYMLPKSIFERRTPISFSKRGYYQFEDVNISGGDFLGLNENERIFTTGSQVVVYPKPLNPPRLLNMLGGFLGDVSVRRFILEDPVLMVGAREYTGKEPFKQLSWKHTARTNQLMVKKFDYTLEPKITVFVYGSLRDKVGDYERDIEAALSLASGVCHYLEQEKISYDFICNTSIPYELGREHYLAEGLGERHLNTILEWLGRATYNTSETFASTLELLRLKQEKNRSTIIITPRKSSDDSALIGEFAKVSGGNVLTLYGEDF